MISVLVVDDDFMVADVHRRLVDRHPGFAVVGVAHSAAEALQAVRELKPDLVVLDVYLPDRSGVELLAAIRASGARCEVIAITAARDPETVEAIMRLGGLRYLIKPFDPATLTSQLAQIHELFEVTRSLRTAVSATQDSIDELFASRHPLSTALPKGLSAVTLELVMKSLQDRESLSATEVSAATGISRASARRYLEHLVAIGRSELAMRYGATGRPEHRYRLLSSGV
jgi:response regulator of citrate/malate metabolism